MRLRAQVVDLVGLDPGQQGVQIARIGQVTVVGLEALVLQQVIDPAGGEHRAAAQDCVHLVAARQQRLGIEQNIHALGQKAGDQLRVGAGARYVGERAGNAVNDFDLPSYTVADAFATYDTRVEGQKVKFQLNVKNLFDRTYYTSAASRFFVSMGDSRQVSLSSTLEF